MYVIGTAGHVDHGKSALVQALTGIDPDRLQEEKARGLTIDLGFAWLQLPSGEEVSIVDVPGHERFIKNMLAGVGGIDLALLVVAADEGVMPQTREHFAILDLLQVRRGIGVITKADLVDEDLLVLVEEEVRDLLADTSLAGAPIVATSARTRQGLDDLAALLDRMLQETPPRRDIGRPRLSIDRAFTISGFGTVVTGTLIDGSLRVGQDVEVAPVGLRTRIRGLQSHRQKVDSIVPGTRTAANLVGLEPSQLARGQTITTPGWLRPTIAADVHLRLIPDAPGRLRHNQQVTFHSLAAESLARVRLLDQEVMTPGESGWAQVYLDNPIPLVKDDFFIIRSTVGTMGGGQVMDPVARRHRRRDSVTLSRLEALARGDPTDVLLHSLEASSPLVLATLARQADISLDEARQAVEGLVSRKAIVALADASQPPDLLLYSPRSWDLVAERARNALASYHSQHPLRRGVPREELRSRLRIPTGHFPAALARLQEEGVLISEGNTLRLPDHAPRLTDAQRREAEALLRLLRDKPYAPPSVSAAEPALLAYLADEGRVVPVGDGVVFTAEACREMTDRIVAHIKEKGTVAVGEVRDMFGTSRKYSLAILEYLDQQHITRRVGDDRVLL